MSAELQPSGGSSPPHGEDRELWRSLHGTPWGGPGAAEGSGSQGSEPPQGAGSPGPRAEPGQYGGWSAKLNNSPLRNVFSKERLKLNTFIFLPLKPN